MTKKELQEIKELRKALAILVTEKGFQRKIIAGVFNVHGSQVTRLLGRKFKLNEKNKK